MESKKKSTTMGCSTSHSFKLELQLLLIIGFISLSLLCHQMPAVYTHVRVGVIDMNVR